MPTIKVGPPVRGDDCYGRDALVGLIWDKLRGGHILLAAPRRFGKTSVMYRLMDEPVGNYKFVHADLEPLIEPSDLVTQLVVQLARDNLLAKVASRLSYFPKKLWSRFTKDLPQNRVYFLPTGGRG